MSFPALCKAAAWPFQPTKQPLPLGQIREIRLQDGPPAAARSADHYRRARRSADRDCARDEAIDWADTTATLTQKAWGN